MLFGPESLRARAELFFRTLRSPIDKIDKEQEQPENERVVEEKQTGRLPLEEKLGSKEGK